MKVSLLPVLNDPNLDAAAPSTQRQLAVSVSATASAIDESVPLNLCLILDHSGSMGGRPLETVKQAAGRLLDRLKPGDRFCAVAFDHKAKVLVPNQVVGDPASIKRQIEQLRPAGGTAIDEGIKLGIEELGKGKKEAISQAFLLTDGENEHGDNNRCLKLAKLAAEYNMTLNSLGFGDNWNQDILEKIADAGGGALAHIQRPEDAVDEFGKLFTRIQGVGLTNAYLLFSLMPKVRLAELKPIAQVAPDTIELPVQQEGDRFMVRLGDLMKDVERVVLANIYIGQLPEGTQAIGQLQIRYDDPTVGSSLLSDPVAVSANVQKVYQPALDPMVQQHILALAKYRQTQLAETRLQQGDRAGAATMLQTAAKTALQMGDKSAATVLQSSATRLQSGAELTEADRKKTRIASKTVLK
ncbi:MAG: VWA domain-containing protein [Microcoleus sp. PH2017_10_PVI_O_A]|uniref:vWA domain-containing protein n=1 Tax=unclassified Microcoleus TaxID=2642155 RepID=UPI001D1C903D|nr:MULTISPECIES: VWA domain-containing protein [unclassified Microcoleus]TAE81861.1 MAG: VWA domain-containing protein [Oscillatoriales cyanobacterium]MCC3406891.1 VWA domain-containing protein [Microcoleus sp. PH2017_10_PVI_O_A]MCC3460985.1 VWA domain-containing protein [Microcoleus sp. PH2017_11_PCY_U_A]MCC3479505.1 VWA domain-containing protein [Microcoleus sp. PH2017_12_PCY_D_A]MCC3529588.1 VWA domain-containing protein [Microcoleus sp. PH2017_21_RUC_O_A]